MEAIRKRGGGGVDSDVFHSQPHRYQDDSDDSHNNRQGMTSFKVLLWRFQSHIFIGGLFLCCIFLAGYPLFKLLTRSADTAVAATGRGRTKTPRFVTIVDSGNEVNPTGRLERIKAIQETWGPKAHVIFVVGSNPQEDPAYHHLMSSSSPSSSSHNNNVTTTTTTNFPVIALPPGVSDRSVPSLQYIIRSLLQPASSPQASYSQYYDAPPDYIFFTNGHTFVLPENLCTYLLEHQLQNAHTKEQPFLYAGHALQPPDKKMTPFHPASAGYVLSLSTMQYLQSVWDAPVRNELCFKATSHVGRFISNCLLWTTNATALDTRERITTTTTNNAKTETQLLHRFHAFPLVRLVMGDIDGWYMERSQTPVGLGKECCSARSVSFHYVEAAETRALYKTQQLLLQLQQQQQKEKSTTSRKHDEKSNNLVTDDRALQSFMTSIWPTNVGHYSRKLPTQNNQELWKILLEILRKISTPPTNPVCSSQTLLDTRRTTRE